MEEHFSLSEIDFENNLGFTEELSKKAKKNLNKITLPYVKKDCILMSPGTWNKFHYSGGVIHKMFDETEWNERSSALFYEHSDKDSRDWVGDIRNIRFKDGFLLGDLYFVDMPLAIKIEYGAKFGISPKIVGEANEKNEVFEGKYSNFSVVLNPAVKTTFLNSEITIKNKEELAMEKTKVDEMKIDYQKLAETLADIMDKRNAEKDAKAKIESELREKIRAELEEEMKVEAEKKAEEAEAEKPAEEAEKPAEEAEKPVEEAAPEAEKPAELSDKGGIVATKVEEVPIMGNKKKDFISEMRDTLGPAEKAQLECMPTEADFGMANWLKGYC